MSDAGAKKVVDASHPEVKSLTDAGIGIDRLTELVNNATKPITHAAVSDATTAAKAEGTTLDQLAQASAEQQTAANTGANAGIVIPPLDTLGLQQASELAPMFQQLLGNIVTPPVPANPNIQQPNVAPVTASQANG